MLKGVGVLMFEKRTGEVMVELLSEWGVDHIYGVPGDSINHVVEELRKKESQIDFIQVRHEEVAALSASSYAKLTGKCGVCLSIAGPGAIHLLNGLYDAKADQAPVLVLAGQIETKRLGTGFFQEAHIDRMFDDVSVFNEQVASEEQLPSLLNQAIRTAYAKKGVAVLTIPDDIPARKLKKQIQKNARLLAEPEISPTKADLDAAISLINDAKQPVILAGKGAKDAREELIYFAEQIGAPIIVSLAGKGIIPDQHPLCLGNLGAIGTQPAYSAMEEADLLVMIGTSFPYTDFLPDDAMAVQIDHDAVKVGLRYPIDVGLVGDAKQTLATLNERLNKKEDQEFLDKYQRKMQAWWEEIERDETEATTPIKPQQVIPALQKVVNDNAILSVDVGNVTVWMARHFRMTNQDFLISSWLGTMGCGLPGAIAAKVAAPERQVVSVCGDGGFSMVMHDFLTAVKYRLPMLVVILNNEKLGMIKYEQQVSGDIESQIDLQPFNFAKFAEICGGKGFRVEQHADLLPAFKAAAQFNCPVIVDVVIEDQPPLPGHISYEQAAGYTKHTIKKFFEKGKFDMPPLKKGIKRLGK